MPETFAPDTGLGRRSILPLPPGPFTGFLTAVLAVVLIAYFTDNALEARQAPRERDSHHAGAGTRPTGAHGVGDAETGQRGFVLTNEDRYLEPYTRARESLPAQTRQLRDLTADNPEQRVRLDELDQMIKRKMDELAQTVASSGSARPAKRWSSCDPTSARRRWIAFGS